MRLIELNHRKASMLFNKYDSPLWFFDYVERQFEDGDRQGYTYHLKLYQIGYHVYWSMN